MQVIAWFGSVSLPLFLVVCSFACILKTVKCLFVCLFACLFCLFEPFWLLVCLSDSLCLFVGRPIIWVQSSKAYGPKIINHLGPQKLNNLRPTTICDYKTW